MLNKHIRNTVIVNNRILRLFISLTKKKRKLKLELYKITARSVNLNLDLRNGSGMNLFIDEFGEETFGFDGGDVAAVVTPDEDAAFDVEEEQSRSCP